MIENEFIKKGVTVNPPIVLEYPLGPYAVIASPVIKEVVNPVAKPVDVAVPLKFKIVVLKPTIFEDADNVIDVERPLVLKFRFAVIIKDCAIPFALLAPPVIVTGDIFRLEILHLSVERIKPGTGAVLNPNGAPCTVIARPIAEA